MLVKKSSAFCSPISISKVCAWTALGGFPHLWDFGGVLMGFWLAFSGVNCELLGVWLFISPFLGFWGFGGVEWKSIGFSLQPCLVALTHFWDFGGILMGF
jgi:hypothetical protein